MRREWDFVYLDADVFLQNHAIGMSHMEYHRRRKPYIEAGKMLARAAGLPKGLAHISISVTHLFACKRPPDPDAAAPAVKGIIDGLVRAEIVADDSGRYVGPVIYEIPVRSAKPGLVVVITEEPPTIQEAVNQWLESAL